MTAFNSPGQTGACRAIVARELLADLTPLRESPAFRRIWVGSTLSAIGNVMTSFALTLQVWDLTRSTVAVGLVALTTLLPLLAAGLLAAVQSAFGAVNAPGRRSLTTSLLPARQQAPAQALQRISFQVMMIAGPALAGLVAGTPRLGLRGCYLIDTVSFGCALYGVGSVPKSLASESSQSDHSERTLRSHSLWLTLVALGVAGAADTITVVARGAIVSIVTPPAFRGRVMAADYAVGAGGPQLGSVEAGAVGSLTIPVIGALSGGVLVIASTAAIALALPAFRRYRLDVHGGEEGDPA
jgi:hypothetical protein